MWRFWVKEYQQRFNPLNTSYFRQNCDRCDSKKHITLVQTRVRARARSFVIGIFTFCICLVWVQHLSGVFRLSSSFETNKASSTKQWYVTLKKWLVFRKMWLVFWEKWLIFRERWLVFVNHYLDTRSYRFVFSKNGREYVWNRAISEHREWG